MSGRAANGCDPLKLYYGLLRCQYPSLHLNSDPINPKLSVMITRSEGGGALRGQQLSLMGTFDCIHANESTAYCT